MTATSTGVVTSTISTVQLTCCAKGTSRFSCPVIRFVNTPSLFRFSCTSSANSRSGPQYIPVSACFRRWMAEYVFPAPPQYTTHPSHTSALRCCRHVDAQARTTVGWACVVNHLAFDGAGVGEPRVRQPHICRLPHDARSSDEIAANSTHTHRHHRTHASMHSNAPPRTQSPSPRSQPRMGTGTDPGRRS